MGWVLERSIALEFCSWYSFSPPTKFVSTLMVQKVFHSFKSIIDAIMLFDFCVWVVTFFYSHDESVFYPLLCCIPAIFINREDVAWFDFPCEVAIKLLQKFIVIKEILFSCLMDCDSIGMTKILKQFFYGMIMFFLHFVLNSISE